MTNNFWLHKENLYPLSFAILNKTLQYTPFQNPGGVAQAWWTKDKEKEPNRWGKKFLFIIMN